MENNGIDNYPPITGMVMGVHHSAYIDIESCYGGTDTDFLGLKQKELQAVMAGEKQLGKHETKFPAIQKALSAINVPLAMNGYRGKIQNGTATYRDHAIRALGYPTKPLTLCTIMPIR